MNVNQYYLHSCILLLEYRLKLRFFIINHDTKVEVKLLLHEESKQCFWSISFMAKIKSHLWIICILMKKTFHQNKVFNKYNHKEDGVNMFQVANITVLYRIKPSGWLDHIFVHPGPLGQVTGLVPTGWAGCGCHTLTAYRHDLYAVADIETVFYGQHRTVATAATWWSLIIPLSY